MLKRDFSLRYANNIISLWIINCIQLCKIMNLDEVKSAKLLHTLAIAPIMDGGLTLHRSETPTVVTCHQVNCDICP